MVDQSGLAQETALPKKTSSIGARDREEYQGNLARIRDYWLGGSHHSERDRVAADRILVCAPQLPYLVRQKRALQRRMVRYLIKHGVRQFLAFESGVPTMGHIHETAQALLPEARVVYVDRDPLIVRDGQTSSRATGARLTCTPTCAAASTCSIIPTCAD